MPKKKKVSLSTGFFAAQAAVYNFFLPHFFSAWLANPAGKRFGIGVVHQPGWDYSNRATKSVGLEVLQILNRYRQSVLKQKKSLKPIQLSYAYTKHYSITESLRQLATEANEQMHLGQLRQFITEESWAEWQAAAQPKIADSRTLYLISILEDSLPFASLEPWLNKRQDFLFVAPKYLLSKPENKLTEEELGYKQRLGNFLGVQYSDDGSFKMSTASFLVEAQLPESSDWPGYSLFLATSEIAVAERFLSSTQESVVAAAQHQRGLFSTEKAPTKVVEADSVQQLIESQASWTNQELYESLLKHSMLPSPELSTQLRICLQQASFGVVGKKKKFTPLPSDMNLSLTLLDYRKSESAYRLVKSEEIEKPDSESQA
jgi:hypothetical protein